MSLTLSGEILSGLMFFAVIGTLLLGFPVAVPLFVVMGVMLERSGIAERLLLTMGKLVGNLRGAPDAERRRRGRCFCPAGGPCGKASIGRRNTAGIISPLRCWSPLRPVGSRPKPENLENIMKVRSIVFGALAAVAFSALPALAEEFLGGAVKTMEIGGQQVLVGSNDMTLYTFDKDEQGVKTNCYDQCAVNWPPLLVPADTEVSGDFTLMDRTDTDEKIVAYKGWPLYFWVKDEKPGDTTGDMVGEVWHTAVYEGM